MRLERLRGGEWLAAAASLALLASLLTGDWYTEPGRDGFHAMAVLRWFCLLAAGLGLALWLAQAIARGPALPVTLDLLGMIVATTTTALLVIRLLSTGAALGWAAYLGVAAAAAQSIGVFSALCAEQGGAPGAETPIVRLSSDPGELVPERSDDR